MRRCVDSEGSAGFQISLSLLQGKGQQIYRIQGSATTLHLTLANVTLAIPQASRALQKEMLNKVHSYKT
eukprot:5968802-Amphidinium_carterae.1